MKKVIVLHQNRITIAFSSNNYEHELLDVKHEQTLAVHALTHDARSSSTIIGSNYSQVLRAMEGEPFHVGFVF